MGDRNIREWAIIGQVDCCIDNLVDSVIYSYAFFHGEWRCFVVRVGFNIPKSGTQKIDSRPLFLTVLPFSYGVCRVFSLIERWSSPRWWILQPFLCGKTRRLICGKAAGLRCTMKTLVLDSSWMRSEAHFFWWTSLTMTLLVVISLRYSDPFSPRKAKEEMDVKGKIDRTHNACWYFLCILFETNIYWNNSLHVLTRDTVCDFVHFPQFLNAIHSTASNASTGARGTGSKMRENKGEKTKERKQRR